MDGIQYWVRDIITPIIILAFSKTVLYGFTVSSIIEFSQLFLARGTDIDDLILNTIGTMVGYLKFIVFSKLFPKFTGNLTLEDDIGKSSWGDITYYLCNDTIFSYCDIWFL